MPEQHGDKSQEATPHRKQKARLEGQVAKSQDLGSAVLLLVGMLALLRMPRVTWAGRPGFRPTWILSWPSGTPR